MTPDPIPIPRWYYLLGWPATAAVAFAWITSDMVDSRVTHAQDVGVISEVLFSRVLKKPDGGSRFVVSTITTTQGRFLVQGQVPERSKGDAAIVETRLSNRQELCTQLPDKHCWPLFEGPTSDTNHR